MAEKIAQVRLRTSICNSLFTRRNFSHCKQNKSGLKRRDFSAEEKKLQFLT